MRYSTVGLCALTLAVGMAATRGSASQSSGAGPRFEITIAKDARAAATTGMVYVAISRDNKKTPIEQTDPTGVPLFSTYVEAVPSGTPIAITAAERGHPIASLNDLPAGEYWVQPFVNVYTRFPRADGKTVWLHMDQWEGQNWKKSPGNISGRSRADDVRSAIERRRYAWSPTRSSRRSNRRPTPSA